MENVYVSLEASQQPAATLNACDAFGHCNSATTGQVVAASETGARTAAYTTGTPLAAVISPLQGRYVASDGPCRSLSSPKQGTGWSVTLSLDGALVETITFAQGETMTSIQRTIPVAVSGEQVHPWWRRHRIGVVLYSRPSIRSASPWTLNRLWRRSTPIRWAWRRHGRGQ